MHQTLFKLYWSTSIAFAIVLPVGGISNRSQVSKEYGKTPAFVSKKLGGVGSNFSLCLWAVRNAVVVSGWEEARVIDESNLHEVWRSRNDRFPEFAVVTRSGLVDIDGDGVIRLVDVKSSKSIVLGQISLSSTHVFSRVLADPSSDLFVLVAPDEAWVVEIRGNGLRKRRIVAQSAFRDACLDFETQRLYLATRSVDSYDLSSLKLLRRLQSDILPQSIDVLPRSGRLFVGDFQGHVRCMSLESGKLLFGYTLAGYEYVAVAASRRSEKCLVIARSRHSVTPSRVYSLDGRQPGISRVTALDGVVSLAFDHRGESLATIDEQARLRVWQTQSLFPTWVRELAHADQTPETDRT